MSTRHLTVSLALVAGSALARPATATIEVIFTKYPGAASSQVPGAIDIDGNPAVTDWRGLESLQLAPGGSHWMIKGRTNLGSTLENILVLGSGNAGTRLLQEGQLAPGGLPDERFEFFGGSASSTVNPPGRFDDNGRYAFSARARTGPSGSTNAPNGHRLFMWDGSTLAVLFKQNYPYTGVFDTIAQPGGNDPGNEFMGDNLNSVHLLNSGVVGFTDNTIGNVAFTLRPASFYNTTLFHQSGGIDTVTDFAGTGTNTLATSSGVSTDRFVTTPDGAHWMMTGTIAGSPSRNVLVHDGRVVIQVAQPIGPGLPTAGSITNFELLSTGHWFAWGTFQTQGGFWLQYDGVVIAKTGDPISPGNAEAWGSTIYGATGNLLGDFVIAASTNSTPDRDDIVLLNDGRVLVREGDPVDANGNGLPDDDVFVGRGANFFGAFNNRCFGLADDGYLYLFINIHDSTGADLGSPSFFGDPNAFVRVATAVPCPRDFNADGNIDPDDLGDYINCFFEAPPCDRADINHDGNVDPDDLGDYINIFFGGC